MKKFFKRNMPDPEGIRKNRWLKIFAPLFNDPYLLHFNRRSVAMGVFCGMVGAFIPLPVQMFVGVGLAILLRGNLACAVGFTWFSNPLTYIPLYYFCFLVGKFILGHPMDANGQPLEVNMEELVDHIFNGEISSLIDFFMNNGSQLMLGCIIVGVIAGFISYMIVSYLWSFHVRKSWRTRKQIRQQRKLNKANKAASLRQQPLDDEK